LKPSITLDERGAILHVTTDKGEGVAVPLNAETVGSVVKSASRLLSPEGKRIVVRALGKALIEMLSPDEPAPESKADG
jgi:hypothetical protein